MCYETMVSSGDFTPVVTLLLILIMHFIAPALLSLAVSESLRKLKLIRFGDMKLEGIARA